MWKTLSLPGSRLPSRLLHLGLVICFIVSFNHLGCNARNFRRKHGHGGGDPGHSYGGSDSQYGRSGGGTTQTQQPIFQQVPQNITVGPGDRAVLKCKVDHLGTKKVSWHKVGVEAPLTIAMFTFIGDDRITVDRNRRANEWSLIIQNIKPEDEGVYYCLISSKEMPTEDLSYKIRLNVKSGSYALNHPAVQVTGESFIEKGDRVEIYCNATGKPYAPKDVQWFKDGEKLDSNAQDGIIITKKIETHVLLSVLIIENSKLGHAGDYVCRSSNSDAGSIKLHILNVPASNVKRDSPPQKSTGRGGGRSALYTSQHSTLIMLVLFLVTLSLTRWRYSV